VVSAGEGGDVTDIEQEIARSREMLGLPEDWDGAGTHAVSEHTWSAAVGLLRVAEQVARERFHYELPAPDIGPCCDGTVDLWWSEPRFELLINVEVSGERFSYYGETRESELRFTGSNQSRKSPDLSFLAVGTQ
jgi:hypothetical protein